MAGIDAPEGIENIAGNECNEQRNEPSMERPTWDFLFNNFTKADLQKHCRKLGLPNIWVTKEKLVDRIMDNYYSLRPRNSNDETNENEVNRNSAIDPLHLVRFDIVNLKELIQKKDSHIEELDDMVKKAHVTINKLNDRISTLEENVRRWEENTMGNERPLPQMQQKLLFIGDNNLGDLKTSDFAGDCTIRTIPEATMDLTKSWIGEQLNFSPHNCILYCGIYDLLDDQVPSYVLDKLGSLVAELKSKHEEINIYACDLVPSLNKELNTKIDEYNQKLAEWSEHNGIAMIKVNTNFKFVSGDIDESCLKDMNRNSGIFLNRAGTLRLLKAVQKQCSFLKINVNTNKNKLQVLARKSRNNLNSHLGQNFGTANPDDVPPSPHPPMYRQNDKVRSRKIYSYEAHIPSHDVQQGFFHNRKQHQRMNEYKGTRLVERSVVSPWSRETPYHSNLPDHRRNEVQEVPRYEGNRRGCHNCGENNHRVNSCRFDHRLKCGDCGRLGHKRKMCDFHR